jgi:hypothetical protein
MVSEMADWKRNMHHERERRSSALSRMHTRHQARISESDQDIRAQTMMRTAAQTVTLSVCKEAQCTFGRLVLQA